MAVSGIFRFGALGSRGKKAGTSLVGGLILASGTYVVNGIAVTLAWSGAAAITLNLTTGTYAVGGNAASFALSGGTSTPTYFIYGF